MPSAIRQPGAVVGDVAATTLQVVVMRAGGGPDGIAAPPPGELLPPGGTLPRDPAPVPARALALDATRLLRRWGNPERRPERWSDRLFWDEVERTRTHLAPVRSRRALAASFGREAFHVARRGAALANADDPGPVRVAYALRWLELGRLGGPTTRAGSRGTRRRRP